MGGGLVKDHKKIAWRYLTTWFIFDLLATLPLDEFAAWAGSSPLHWAAFSGSREIVRELLGGIKAIK